MRLIFYVGIVAVLAAIGWHFGEEYYGGYYGDRGPMLGAFLGGAVGLLVISGLRAASPRE